MNKKLKLIITVVGFILLLSGVNLYADNQAYHKLS